MKIIVFGKNGRVGSLLCGMISQRHDLFASGRADLDLETAPANIIPFIKEVRPHVIINAAACNGPEACYANPGRAYALNAQAPALMAAAARDLGALFVHYSTDYVFGDSREPLTEDTMPHPMNLYGHSKLAGECAIATIAPYHTIFRLSSVYGADLAGPLDAIKQFRAGRGTPENPIQVLRQLCMPIHARRAAALTMQVVELAHTNNMLRTASGLYHMAPMGAVWKSDFARAAIYLSGHKEPVSIVEGTLAQPRPVQLPLSGAKLCTSFGIDAWSPYEDLATMFGNRAHDFDEIKSLGRVH